MSIIWLKIFIESGYGIRVTTAISKAVKLLFTHSVENYKKRRLYLNAMELILTSFGTEMNKLSPVSTLVPAGYKTNTKKPHNRKKMLVNKTESAKQSRSKKKYKK